MNIITFFNFSSPRWIAIQDKIDDTGPPIINKIKEIFSQFPKFVQVGLLHARYISAASAFVSLTNIIFLPVEYFLPKLSIFNTTAKTCAFVLATGFTKNEGLGLNIEHTHADGLLRLGTLWLGT